MTNHAFDGVGPAPRRHNNPPALAQDEVDVINECRSWEAAAFVGPKRWGDPEWVEHINLQKKIIAARERRSDDRLSPDKIGALVGWRRKVSLEAAYTLAVRAYSASEQLNTPVDMAILHWIHARSDNAFGRCKDGAESIANFAMVARDTAERRLAALYNAGIIDRAREPGKTTAYWLVYPESILARSGRYAVTAFSVTDALVVQSRPAGRPRREKNVPDGTAGTLAEKTPLPHEVHSEKVPDDAVGTLEEMCRPPQPVRQIMHRLPSANVPALAVGQQNLPKADLPIAAAVADGESAKPSGNKPSELDAQPGPTVGELEAFLDQVLVGIDRTKVANLMFVGPVMTWVAQGLDLQQDILPTIQRLSITASQKGRQISSWQYFHGAICEAAATRKAQAARAAEALAAQPVNGFAGPMERRTHDDRQRPNGRHWTLDDLDNA